jgi:hypothetical protein
MDYNNEEHVGERITYDNAPSTPTSRALRAATRKESRRISRSVSEEEEADLVAQEEDMEIDDDEEEESSDKEVEEERVEYSADPVRCMAVKGMTDTFSSIFQDSSAVAAATLSSGSGQLSGLIDLANPAAFGILVEKELFGAYSVQNNIGNFECTAKVSTIITLTHSHSSTSQSIARFSSISRIKTIQNYANAFYQAIFLPQN